MKRTDIFLLVAWAILPPLLLFALHGNFFVSIILYLVLPSVYFTVSDPRILPRALATGFLAMLVGVIPDYLAYTNGAWAVPTIFPFRVFDLLPIEDFFFIFWTGYVIVSGFAHFFPEFRLHRIKTRRLLISAPVCVFAFFFFFTFLRPLADAVHIPYYDAVLLFFAFILPTILLWRRYPDYRRALLWAVLAQLIIMLPYELTSDALGFWSFPSTEYLARIHLLGQTFPLEEFLQWMICMVPTVLTFNILVID